MDTRTVTPPDRPGAPPEPAGPAAGLANVPAWPLAPELALDDPLSEFANDADVVRRVRSVKTPSRARAAAKWPIVAAVVVVALCLAAA